MRHILILGGTGAIGNHVSVLLADNRSEVVVTSRSHRSSSNEDISFVQGDAKDFDFLADILSSRHWDTIIDFMVWGTDEFERRLQFILDSTDQYIFTSSYRVYASSPVIVEDSPRLLDAVNDVEYLSTDEYALSKARCEDLLRDSGRSNWTIIRPAVSYDGTGRFQLGVLEATEWLPRAIRGIPVPVPEEIASKQATMTWGGDVALMISRLVGNSLAYGEAFTVSTSEHTTWRSIVSFYSHVVPLELVVTTLEGFLTLFPYRNYQVRYDRLYDRVIDNSKVLRATGLTQGDLLPIEQGLISQLNGFLSSASLLPLLPGLQGKYDRLIGGFPALGASMRTGVVGFAQYAIRRLIR